MKNPHTLSSHIGSHVLLFCMNYFYAGKVVSVDEHTVCLESPQIVYETGAFDAKVFKDAQDLPTNEWHIQISMIESFGKLAK